ncbi:hypothetical protein BDB00DRAFT_790262 [Zychaea mexicana]|uniref:uncharacterized protein n=1 Tax=Zychaea mexicana TaxID=64656 RepID=UPI0022FED53E|nr:uncharacterized protein BDB00DRAFT_790262 [Zychaea mexicana]KAI9490497.1 hypothetical protein BDB00DRAFT_790262 [Zychaea mexicana]
MAADERVSLEYRLGWLLVLSFCNYVSAGFGTTRFVDIEVQVLANGLPSQNGCNVYGPLKRRFSRGRCYLLAETYILGRMYSVRIRLDRCTTYLINHYILMKVVNLSDFVSCNFERRSFTIINPKLQFLARLIPLKKENLFWWIGRLFLTKEVASFSFDLTEDESSQAMS